MKIKLGDKEAPFYDVIDLDVGKRIELVQSADDETGEYTCYERKENGELKDEWIGDELNCMLFNKKGNIKLMKKKNEKIR